MKFGYFVGQELAASASPADAVREAVAEAVAAEEAGFDGVFVSEHHQAKAGYLPAPIPLMYLLASATTRIHVGSAVLLLSLAQPTRVAEEIALLDHTSHGRVIAGLGIGYIQDDFDAFGVDRRHGPSLFEEGVELLRRLWSEPTVDFFGKRYQLRNVSVLPRPLTPGGPPIWIGGRSLVGARRAARSGDAWLLDATPRLDLFREWYHAYRELALARGRSPSVGVLRDSWVDLGPRDDAVYREAVMAAHRAKIAGGVYDLDPLIAGRRPEEVTFDELARDRWLTGDGAAIRDELGRWRSALGIDWVLIRVRTRGRPGHELAVRQIRAFGETVIGPLRARAANH